MAIDTRQKRRSAMRARLPWKRTRAPIPDGSFSQADRQQLLGMYAGILWSTPSDLYACYVFTSEIKEEYAFTSEVNETYVFDSNIKVKAD